MLCFVAICNTRDRFSARHLRPLSVSQRAANRKVDSMGSVAVVPSSFSGATQLGGAHVEIRPDAVFGLRVGCGARQDWSSSFCALRKDGWSRATRGTPQRMRRIRESGETPVSLGCSCFRWTAGGAKHSADRKSAGDVTNMRTTVGEFGENRRYRVELDGT